MDKKAFIIAFVLILLFAGLLRYYELDIKPYHHDESVHAHFSYRLFADGYYEGYNPTWHGPFQFYASTVVFHIFGDSDWSGRFLPALFGTLLVLLPLFLRKYIGDAGALFSSFLLALSPAFLYYSRFFRNDIYIAFFSLGMLICVFLYLETKKLLPLCIGALFLALSLAAKENTYLTLVIFVSFGAAYMFVRNFEYAKEYVKKIDDIKKTISSLLAFLAALITTPIWPYILPRIIYSVLYPLIWFYNPSMVYSYYIIAFFIFFPIFFGIYYVLFTLIQQNLLKKIIVSLLHSLKSLLKSPFSLIKQHPRKVILALALFLFVYYLLYSFFFAGFFSVSDPEKIRRYLTDPFYAPVKAFSHWGTYSTGPTGPFFFYFPALMLLYELPIMVFGLLAIFYYVRENSSKAFFASLIVTPLWLYVFSKNIYSGMSWAYDWYVVYSIHVSAFAFFFLLFFGIFCVLYSLRLQHDRKQLLALFLCYWSLTSIVIYASVYEKAPWLLPHMLLPMVILTGMFFDNFKKMKVVLAVAIILSSLFVYASVNLNYVHYADPAEPMLQAAQPGNSFRDIINKINEIADKNEGFNTKIQIAKVGEKEESPREKISGTQTTQYLWYLRKFKNLSWGVNWSANPKELNAPLILSHWEYADRIGRNLTGYKRMNGTAMGWYWWRPEDFSPEYYFFRTMNRTPDGDKLVLFYRE